MFLCDWIGNKGVELLDLILALSVLGVVAGMVLVAIIRLSTPKKAKKAGDTAISEAYEVYGTQVKDILKIKDTQISSLTSKLKRLEAQEYQEVPESSGKEVTFEEITSLVRAKYPKYAALLPLIKKQVMDATKGMPMSEILDYVKQFTGDKGSKDGSNPESATYNPNWA